MEEVNNFRILDGFYNCVKSSTHEYLYDLYSNSFFNKMSPLVREFFGEELGRGIELWK